MTDSAPPPSARLEGDGARRVLQLIAAKWTVPIVRCLVPTSQRPSELLGQLAGLSQKVLTQNLRRLERSGWVDRQVHATVPPRVDYRLTPLGRTLIAPLDVLDRWVEQHGPVLPAPAAPRRAAALQSPRVRRRKRKPGH